MNGTLRPDELSELTGLKLPEGDFETVGGFIMHRLGRIPAEDDECTWEGWQFRVRRLVGNRIERVEVTEPGGSV